MTQPATAPGYRPRSAQNDLKDIIEDHLEELFGGYEEKFKALGLTQHLLGAKLPIKN